MSFASIIEALSLPSQTLVQQRVPKKLLLEQSAITAADKRQISEGIEEVHWIAALKPSNIGVRLYRDELREYQEISVLTVLLRTGAKQTRLLELLHRAIPYPVFLVVGQEEFYRISLAHKRWAQGPNGKVVMDEARCTQAFKLKAPKPEEDKFLQSLALSSLPNCDLFALYQGWIDRLIILEASQISGIFDTQQTTERIAELTHSLENHSQLLRKLISLRTKATKEKQLRRRVELNTEIKQVEQQLAELEFIIGIGRSQFS